MEAVRCVVSTRVDHNLDIAEDAPKLLNMLRKRPSTIQTMPRERFCLLSVSATRPVYMFLFVMFGDLVPRFGIK